MKTNIIREKFRYAKTARANARPNYTISKTAFNLGESINSKRTSIQKWKY